MKVLRKFLARGKVRSARKALAKDPSPRAYAALVHEYTSLGMTVDALAVCEEGLQAFAGNTLLTRLFEQTRRTEREERMAMLKSELADAPRPALWKEMCEAQLEVRAYGRAAETAQAWVEKGGGGEALFMVARVCYERFVDERSRGLGHAVIKALDAVASELDNDERVLALRLEFLTRIGAWSDAKEAARLLLQVQPGMPDLETRFRTLEDRAADAPTIERALVAVERTGRFADDDLVTASSATTAEVRPVLRQLEEHNDVHAALYVRGATVLMQGPRGATAERMARGVRAIVSSGRATTRRLGLGQVSEITLEGEFGTLSLAAGEADAGAVWTDGALGAERRAVLHTLAGINANLVGEHQ